jgi:hypothetical protein|tara:strand:- start:304 stop:534 length:231 start_codon:yes stop_codon:yes gene_type:complete
MARPKSIIKFNRFEYYKYVENLLKQRHKVGVLKNEADFISGASAVFAHLDMMGVMPPKWYIYPMSGRSLLDGQPND